MSDFAAIIGGATLAIFIFVPPGYAVGFWLNLLCFRDAGLWWRLTCSVLISVSLLPFATYIAAKVATCGIIILYSLLYCLFFAAIFRDVSKLRRMRDEAIKGMSDHPMLTFGLVLWAMICAASLADVEISDTLYISLTSYDYAKHVAVTDSIVRTGVPPINPSFFPGRPVPLFYYYFWFTLCANLYSLAGGLLTVQQSVGAMTIWAGYSLCCATAISLSVFAGVCGRWAEGTKLAILLLLVTGLDLIPVVFRCLFEYFVHGQPFWYPTIEWWNEQVSAWVDATIWVPHHVAGLVACVFGLVCLRQAADTCCEWHCRSSHAIIAGLAFASAVGLSVWLAFVTSIALGVWLVVCLIVGQRREVLLFLFSGIITGILSSPYVLDLNESNQRHGLPVVLAVRTFSPIAESRFGQVPYISLLYLLALPVNYGIEFGFFAIGAALYWKRRIQDGSRLRHGELFWVVLASVCLLICTFVRSAIRNNDLGWRGLMPVQFILLLWTASVLAAARSTGSSQVTSSKKNASGWIGWRWGVALFATALTGGGGLVYDLVMMRMAVSNPPAIPLKEAYEWARLHTPTHARFQHVPTEDVEVFHGLYGNRQVILADGHYGIIYGVSQKQFNDLSADVNKLFEPTRTWESVRVLGDRLRIEWLVVKETDAVWKNKDSWVWSVTPQYSNSSVRIFAVNPDNE